MAVFSSWIRMVVDELDDTPKRSEKTWQQSALRLLVLRHFGCRSGNWPRHVSYHNMRPGKWQHWLQDRCALGQSRRTAIGLITPVKAELRLIADYSAQVSLTERLTHFWMRQFTGSGLQHFSTLSYAPTWTQSLHAFPVEPALRFEGETPHISRKPGNMHNSLPDAF
jgi:hypothetical protein